MTYDWQTCSTLNDGVAVASLPPATIGETGWDLLLALHADRHGDLNLEKLTSLVSAPIEAMTRWLAALENHRLITGANHRATGELIAVLTPKGRELLDHYLTATGTLQVKVHH